MEAAPTLGGIAAWKPLPRWEGRRPWGPRPSRARVNAGAIGMLGLARGPLSGAVLASASGIRVPFLAAGICQPAWRFWLCRAHLQRMFRDAKNHAAQKNAIMRETKEQ